MRNFYNSSKLGDWRGYLYSNSGEYFPWQVGQWYTDSGSTSSYYRAENKVIKV